MSKSGEQTIELDPRVVTAFINAANRMTERNWSEGIVSRNRERWDREWEARKAGGES